MLRIAQLIESDGPGGAEQVVADLAVNLQAAGARSLVILPAHGDGWLARQLAGTGVGVEHFRLETPFSPACARSVANALRRHRIDVAHSHEFSMAVYGAWASWRAGVPHVITMHGSRYYAGRLPRRVALRAAIARSDCLVAVSHALAAHISRDLLVRRAHIDVIANGVRSVSADGAAVRHELELTADDRLLVSIGNLYPVKGHRHLIDAVARLSDRHPTVHLAIAGRGSLADGLGAHARECGLETRVHLLGLRSDVAALLAAADVFVLPSLSEGLPLALLEAMFAGRPIVASEVGDIAAALGHGAAGVLVPPGDPAALAASLDDLLTRPDRARTLGAHARRRAADQYDVSHMVRRYRSIYDRVLARSPLPVGSFSAGSARPNL
jgi:glycosyltransferase involved in cell wall biosynthesis